MDYQNDNGRDPYNDPYRAQETPDPYDMDLGTQTPSAGGTLVKGIIGAVLGSLPGIILWIVLGYFNIISGWAGMLIAFGIMIGYTKLGGELTTAGGIVCFFWALVSIYLGVHLSYSAQLYMWQPDPQIAVFGLYGWLIKRDLLGSFLGTLGLGYLFGLGGIIGMLRKRS